MKKLLIPKLGDILFISLTTTALLFGPRMFNLDGDLGRHITIGNYIINNIEIPRTDIFSHTMFGQPLTPHEWLAQVLFALFHRLLGLPGVVLVTALIISATFTLVFSESQEHSLMPVISLMVTLLAAAASSLHWLSRPHITTFLFHAVWILLLERIQRGKQIPVWVFGILMLLWANTHGAFLAGFVTWSAYLIGEFLEIWETRTWRSNRLKIWMMIGLISLAASFINPVALNLWGTGVSFISNSYLVSHTQEYLPPNFHIPNTWPFMLLIALSIIVLGSSQKRLSNAHLLLLSGWTVMGLYSARNIPLYAIIAAPILSEKLAENLTNPYWKKLENNLLKLERSLHGAVWVIITVIVVLFFISTPPMRVYNRFDSTIFPVDAINWLEDNPQEGKVFNYFSWGGFLLYREWPEILVFIDGQTDFYGESLTREYELAITASPSWEGVLDRHDVTWAIIPRTAKLSDVLQSSNDWEIIYQDEIAIIARELH